MGRSKETEHPWVEASEALVFPLDHSGIDPVEVVGVMMGMNPMRITIGSDEPLPI
jgi:hypothetical protein